MSSLAANANRSRQAQYDIANSNGSDSESGDNHEDGASEDGRSASNSEEEEVQDNTNVVTGTTEDESEFQRECSEAIPWHNAHRLQWKTLVDPKSKPVIEEEVFDFRTWDTMYAIMAERITPEDEDVALKVIFEHFTRLPTSKKSTGFGHSFSRFLRSVEHFDSQLVPVLAAPGDNSVGGVLGAAAKEGWSKLNSLPKKIEFMKELEKRLHPSCSCWADFHARVRCDLQGAFRLANHPSASSHSILGAATAGQAESGTVEANRWALVAHCALDTEGSELLATAETGVPPARRETSGAARRMGMIDDMNLQGGHNAIKKRAQKELLEHMEMLRPTLRNPFSERSFEWTSDVANQSVRLDRPLRYIYPNCAVFKDGGEISAVYTKMRNERARVEKNYDKSGTHCTGIELDNLIAPYCMRGGSTVVDPKLLYTVLLWKDKDINNVACALPSGMGMQLGTNTPSRLSSRTSSVPTSSSAVPTISSSIPTTSSSNNNSTDNSRNSNYNTPSSSTNTTYTNSRATHTAGIHASEGVSSSVAKRNSNKRSLTEATATINATAKNIGELVQSLSNQGGAGTANNCGNDTTTNSAIHTLDYLVPALFEADVKTVEDLLEKAGLTPGAFLALSAATGLMREDKPEHLVSLVLECGLLRKSSFTMAAKLGLTLRDCSYLADYLYFLAE